MRVPEMYERRRANELKPERVIDDRVDDVENS